MNSFENLFLHFAKDIYFAENQILKSLPKLAEAAQNPDLRETFEQHEIETKGQIQRLEEVFQLLDEKPEGVKCPAILGLIEECEEVLQQNPEPSAVRDAGLIACGQAIEHYEMARYGALLSWASEIGMDDAVSLLEQTLAEEKNADTLLNELAKERVNSDASQQAA